MTVEDEFEGAQETRCCPTCGGVALLQGRHTRFYVPLNMEQIDIFMDKESTNDYILERLRRAEVIIKELRIQLKENGKD